MNNKTNSTYEYQENKLVITIPTSDPAAFHDQLMKALTSSMRNYIRSEEANESQLVLIDLLETLLPGERTLSKMV